jgi:pimeloyl-ACP methyl ester carboxylesterase/DNA-binding SARP family transcriptional activator
VVHGTVHRRRPLGVRWRCEGRVEKSGERHTYVRIAPMDARTDARPPRRTIELACAGYPDLQVDGQRIALNLKRGLALLVHLGDTPGGCGRRVARDRLADLLWPDAPGDVARGRLRRLCHQVNALLGFDLLVGDADAIWLGVDSAHIDSDVMRVRRAAMQLVTDPAAAESRRSLELVCTPSAPHLLHGFDAGSGAFEGWLDGRRAEQERLVMRALSRSAEHLLAAGQPMLAAEAATALIRLEPLADAGHVYRLAAQGQLGDAAGVESAYFACAELLRSELGIKPSAQIEAAYAQARARLATALEDEPRGASALPPIRFADTDDGSVAYLELGSRAAPGGTMVILFGLWSHVEVAWDQPVIRATLDRLARRFHVVLMDRRGVGLSERLTLKQSVETGMADLEAVRRALGVESVWLFANSVGAAFGVEYAVRHRERVRGLLFYSAAARGAWASDYPWAPTPAQLETWLAKLQTNWGSATSLEQFAPSVADDPGARDWWARLLRQSLTRNSLPRLLRAFAEMDVRDRLAQVRVPTLVVQREGDRIVRAAAAQHLADHIDGAKLVLLPGEDNLMWWGDTEAVIDQVERFVDDLGAR